jgi:cell division protein ZapB
MDTQLASFEQKIEKVLAFCQALREENRQLRGRVAGLESENRQLSEKIDTTVTRLEALMERLPNQ